MYAPNKPHLRTNLWNELVDNIEKNRRWVVAGDFNMVEDTLDRKGGFGRVVNGSEKKHGRNLYENSVLKIPMFIKEVNLNIHGTIRNFTGIILVSRIAPSLGIES